jgi:hypothetical protein
MIITLNLQIVQKIPTYFLAPNNTLQVYTACEAIIATSFFVDDTTLD